MKWKVEKSVEWYHLTSRCDPDFEFMMIPGFLSDDLYQGQPCSTIILAASSPSLMLVVKYKYHLYRTSSTTGAHFHHLISMFLHLISSQEAHPGFIV